MKKQFWFLIVIVLVALLLGGFAWMHLSRDTSDAASSPNGETEIIPDDPNEPWPDLSADASSDASDGSGSSAPDSSNPVETPGTPVPGSPALPGDTANSASSSDSSGNTSSSGGSASAGGPVSGNGSSSSGSPDIPDNTPGGGVPSEPDSDAEDDDPVVSQAELHEYELPYIPLS